jgi:GNAT superfamily N-acetyltransferase
MGTAEAVIRWATPRDVSGLMAGVTALFAEDAGTHDPLRNARWPAQHGEKWCRELLAERNALVLVADAEGQVVGHLVGTYAAASELWLGARAVLVNMYVAPEWRAGGVGSRLVEEFTAWARRRGAARLFVEAYAANEGAVRFYRRNGFVPMSTMLAADL